MRPAFHLILLGGAIVFVWLVWLEERRRRRERDVQTILEWMRRR